MRFCLCLGFFFFLFFSFLLYRVSILYDSAFLMFVVYRNKHEKVAFLLDSVISGFAQEAPMRPKQVRGSWTSPSLCSWDICLKTAGRFSAQRCLLGQESDKWGRGGGLQQPGFVLGRCWLCSCLCYSLLEALRGVNSPRLVTWRELGKRSALSQHFPLSC